MSTLMVADTAVEGASLDMMGGNLTLWMPENSSLYHVRCRLGTKWYSKTTDCKIKPDAIKEIPRVVAEICKEHHLQLPDWILPSAQTEKDNKDKRKPGEKSINVLARAKLDQRAKEGRWKSAHIYYSALGYMERGFGSAGDLPPRLVPRAAFMKLRDFLTDCEDIARSASEYGRRICWILKQVEGVPPEHIKLLGRIPGDKGDEEKGESFSDSQMRTILVNQETESDETTRMMVGVGLSGGPQIIDSCFIPFSGIDWSTGRVSFRRVKSGEAVVFYLLPWVLELFRRRWERLGSKAAYAFPDLIFTQEELQAPNCNTVLWKNAPKPNVQRASVNGSTRMRRFLRERCGFTSLELTNKSFRIHRISFWASCGFKLKTRMRMAGHVTVERHTAYDRGAEVEMQRARDVSEKYYEAIREGRPFFIPTTPLDLYEVIEKHWEQLPGVVRHCMRVELLGSFAELHHHMMQALAKQRDQIEKFREAMEAEARWSRASLTAILNHLGLSLPLAA